MKEIIQYIIMVRLVEDKYYAKGKLMESFLSNKETDCILYSKEGIEFDIHN